MTFNTALDSISTYEAGKPIELVVREFGIKENEIIKLASNENPLGASPKVLQSIVKNVSNIYLYPDDSMFALKESLSQYFKVHTNEIIIGAGSDQIIEFCIHAKANKNSKILMAKTTFAMYEIYSKAIGARVIKTQGEIHNLTEFLECYNTHNPSIIFLCVPNNPLGDCLDKSEIYEFLKQINEDTLVIIDGAYQEYAKAKDSAKSIDPQELINSFPNTIYLGTFSKAYGLGGMRIGYGIAKESIIKALSKLRPPFNVTTLSLLAALEALKDQEHIQKSLQNNLEQMPYFESFAKEQGLDYIPSYTNFITYFLKEIDSTQIANFLLQRGVIIRNLSSYGLNAIRITIGTKEQNKKFFTLFHHFLNQK
ncbi:histidinol-phosphate transaminase [Helicobacter mesocricetorum]|uniref:histidinol-phosphate transaminase n=1 Tax=Helicobacter mesocricetorum TaxID=87012 RepID=UPI000CF15249|nr:histidinol-phosphate transaminase [Helicobacter mesocricetorum]